MEWNDVKHFLALARTGSVRAAGQALGVSHSTVARRVEALEEKLNTLLFDRSRDGYALTNAGVRMLPGAERIEEEMAALERDLAGTDERLAGPVSITCCDNFVARLLIRELREFCIAHPQIELAFAAESRLFSLTKREADLAIRTLPREGSLPENLIGMKLGEVVFASYVAREYEERLNPEAGFARFVSTTDRNMQEQLIAMSSHSGLAAWGSFASLDLMLEAARAGYGLVMLPTYVGDQDSTLCRLEKDDERHLADLWLLCHPDLRDNARLRAVRAEIYEVFKRWRMLF